MTGETKLTEEQKAEMRSLHVQGHGYRRLSKIFSVRRNTVRKLVSDAGRQAYRNGRRKHRASRRLQAANPADRARLLELYATAARDGFQDDEWFQLGLKVFGNVFRDSDLCDIVASRALGLTS